MSRIIDTHIHVWDFDRADYPWLKGDISILNRLGHIEEIEKERMEAGIIGGVLVQASCNLRDTELMIETAQKTYCLKWKNACCIIIMQIFFIICRWIKYYLQTWVFPVYHY